MDLRSKIVALKPIDISSLKFGQNRDRQSFNILLMEKLESEMKLIRSYLAFAKIARESITLLSADIITALAKLNPKEMNRRTDERLRAIEGEQIVVNRMISSYDDLVSYDDDIFCVEILRPFLWWRRYECKISPYRKSIPLIDYQIFPQPGTQLKEIRNRNTTDICLLFESETGYNCAGTVVFKTLKRNMPEEGISLQECHNTLDRLRSEKEQLMDSKSKIDNQMTIEAVLTKIAEAYDDVIHHMAIRKSDQRYESLKNILMGLWPPQSSGLIGAPRSVQSFVEMMDEYEEFERIRNPRRLVIEEVHIIGCRADEWKNVKSTISSD
jgi:hypothetical protein